MEVLESLSDEEIRQKLIQLGHPVGPVTATTRKILIRKLKNLMANQRISRTRYSSAEESGSELELLDRNMPPPSASRYRRYNNSNSIGNTSDKIPGKVGSFSYHSKSGTRRNKSMSPILFESDPVVTFTLGSDSDYSDNSWVKTNTYRGLSSYRSQLNNRSTTALTTTKPSSPSTTSTPKLSSLKKDTKPFLSSLRRLTRFRTNLNPQDIKETDVDAAPYYRQPLKYRENTSVRPIYEHTPEVEPPGFFTHLPMALLIIFLLFLVWLGATYFIRVSRQTPPRITATATSKSTNVYPLCPDSNYSSNRCIPKDKLLFVVGLYKDVHQTLLARNVQSMCGPLQQDGTYVNAYMTQREVVQFLLKARPSDAVFLEDGVKYLALLFISNPHWGVSVIREPSKSNCPIPDQLHVVPSDIAAGIDFLLITPCPIIPWICRFQLIFFNLMYYLVSIFTTVAVVFLIHFVWNYYQTQVRAEEEVVNGLVGQILNKLGEICGSNQEYVPIRHIHDILIPPADRPRMSALWEKAEAFIDKHESRVRREVQTVWGEETAVWRLLLMPGANTSVHQSPSHMSQSPASTTLATPLNSTSNADTAVNRLYPDLSGQIHKEVTRVWQGEAFETSEGSMNSLSVSPTPCLKIRHMFKPNRFYGADWETGVKDAILEKCEGIRIYHVAVDKASKDGCVFLKCASSQEAGMAFRQLHGSWFDGALVTVKYLRLERYHERFPEAINMTTPLQPSNDLKLSLGGVNSFDIH